MDTRCILVCLIGSVLSTRNWVLYLYLDSQLLYIPPLILPRLSPVPKMQGGEQTIDRDQY